MAQRDLGLTLVNVSEVNGKIDPLRKVEFVGDAAPDDDIPVGTAKHGATGSNDAIDRRAPAILWVVFIEESSDRELSMARLAFSRAV